MHPEPEARADKVMLLAGIVVETFLHSVQVKVIYIICVRQVVAGNATLAQDVVYDASGPANGFHGCAASLDYYRKVSEARKLDQIKITYYSIRDNSLDHRAYLLLRIYSCSSPTR